MSLAFASSVLHVVTKRQLYITPLHFCVASLARPYYNLMCKATKVRISSEAMATVFSCNLCLCITTAASQVADRSYQSLSYMTRCTHGRCILCTHSCKRSHGNSAQLQSLLLYHHCSIADRSYQSLSYMTRCTAAKTHTAQIWSYYGDISDMVLLWSLIWSYYGIVDITDYIRLLFGRYELY